jgi:hypothetical protein
MSNHVIHVKSCHSCQILSFMSNHVEIHVIQVIIHVYWPSNVSEQAFSKKSVGGEWEGSVKKCFQGLRQTAFP